MKFPALLFTLTCAASPLLVHAALSEKVVVYATETGRGSLATTQQHAYTRAFKVTIANLSEDTLNLADYCLQAQTAEKKTFRLDTVDSALAEGKLAKGDSKKGDAVFASDDAAIFQPMFVTLTDQCEKK